MNMYNRQYEKIIINQIIINQIIVFQYLKSINNTLQLYFHVLKD